MHVFTSPHLVRFNERVRLASRLIDDELLAALLEEVLDAGGDIGASFFEVTTAAAFLAFRRIPADACVIEVGLGGRLDATNVLPAPAVCGIAQLGVDHEAFLGSDPIGIAREKAGIAKPGTPLVTFDHGPSINTEISRIAASAGAPMKLQGVGWQFEGDAPSRRVVHHVEGLQPVVTPWPCLYGDHQVANLGLAVAMLRFQDSLTVPVEALSHAAIRARWPARMQRLADGPITCLLPPGSELWLDGGHNPAAAAALANALAAIGQSRDMPTHLVIGMLANKDIAGLLGPIAAGLDGVVAVPIRDHVHHAPSTLANLASRLGIARTATAPDVTAALHELVGAGNRGPLRVLIAGSLYLAGEVLQANDEMPT